MVEYTPQTWQDNAPQYPLSAQRMLTLETAAQSASRAGLIATGSNTVYIDDPQFAGASDDAKLANMLAYAAAQTNIPVCMIGRAASFTQPVTRFSGMKLFGYPIAPGVTDMELASKKYATTAIKVNCAANGGVWMVGSGTIYNQSFWNMALYSTDNGTQLYSSTGNDYASVYGNHVLYGFKSVFGSVATKYLNTQINVVGEWVINPIIGGGGIVVHAGGSDSDWWYRGSLNVGGQPNGNGAYLFWFDSQGKSNLGPVYPTLSQNASTGWGGCRFSGSITSMRVFGGRWEGVNASNPTPGSIFQLDSSMTSGTTNGKVDFVSNRTGFAMSAPNTNGRTTDGGVINQDGGIASWFGGEYERASTVAESVPWWSLNGGEAYIYGVGRLGAWASKPGVKVNGGTLVNDASVVTL